jgi:hypothetical protein
MRKLASIQKIEDIQPIPKADRIEVATVQGWECVVSKGEFEIGDLCVYFEVDSILPEHEIFEFMRQRKFRVKTIKLRKQISQGLAMPLTILKEILGIPHYGLKVFEIGDDVTKDIGVKKHDPEGELEKKLVKEMKGNKIFNFFMKYRSFRWMYFKIKKQPTSPFPTDIIKKTDETRIQNIPSRLKDVDVYYASEKLDGQSATFIKSKKLIVCSRNLALNVPDNSNYWKIAKKLDLENILPDGHIIQGEIIGPNIQKNRYGLDELDFYVFNVFCPHTNKFMNRYTKDSFCKYHNLKIAPIVENIIFLKDFDMKTIVKYSKGKSVIGCKPKREGLVFRNIKDETKSFKCINPDYLLEFEKKS